MNQDTPMQPVYGLAGILSYDLVLPVQPLLPAWTPLRYYPVEIAANARRAEAERRETEARVALETGVAIEEWRVFREQHADNLLAISVLDIHEPEAGEDGVVCGRCLYADYDGAVATTWPCRTYDAMRAAAETSKNERSVSA